MPRLTYGSEIFGFENLDMLEKIHIDFLKKITKCRRSTPSYIIYTELGRFPIEIMVKSRIIGYWNSDYWKRWRDVIIQHPGHSHGYKSITVDA